MLLAGDPSRSVHREQLRLIADQHLARVGPYAGAAGNTAAQMKDSMHVATASDVYFRSLNWLDQQLESRAAAALKQAQALYWPDDTQVSAASPPALRFIAWILLLLLSRRHLSTSSGISKACRTPTM